MVEDSTLDLPNIPEEPSDEEVIAHVDAILADAVPPAGMELTSRISNAAKYAVLKLAQRGWSVRAIADKLGISMDVVRNNLSAALAEEFPLDDINELRSFYIGVLRRMERRCETEYHKSCQPTQTLTLKEDPERGLIRTEVTHPPKPNPAWEKLRLEAIKRIEALTGMAMPTRHEISKEVKQTTITAVVVKTPQDVIDLKAAGLLE